MTDLDTRARQLAGNFTATNNNGTATSLIHALRRHVRNRRTTRQLRKLQAYDDDTLSDIGASRDELGRSLNKRRSTRMDNNVGNIHMADMHPQGGYIRH